MRRATTHATESPVTPLEPLLRVPEAARALGLSVSHLNKMRLTGAGPKYRRCGRVVVYAPADLRAFIAGLETCRSTSEYADAGR